MPDTERRRFERHLEHCDGCEHYLAQMRRTIETTGRLRADDVDALPAGARANLLQAFAAYRHER
jgi:anti-sigma factor RsiW